MSQRRHTSPGLGAVPEDGGRGIREVCVVCARQVATARRPAESGISSPQDQARPHDDESDAGSKGAGAGYQASEDGEPDS